MSTAPHYSLNPLLAAALCMACAPSVWATIDQPTEPYISYTVQPKDVLIVVTRQLLTDPGQWPKLAKLNGLKNPNVIKPGQIIDVPLSMINFANQPKLATQGVLDHANGTVTINNSPAQRGAAVPEGARVQTAAGSSAVIKLSDGSAVQLMPRTLAEVVTQHGYALRDPATGISTTWFSGVIRLVEGALDVAADKAAKRKEPLGVTTPTSSVGVRGTQFRVAYEDPAVRSARAEVLEGKVQVGNTAQGASADVNGGFGVVVKPDERELKVVALLPALPESALPARVERTQEGQPAVWTVAALGGAVAYRVQLAADAAFSQISFDGKSAEPAIKFGDVPNGSYFARVRGIDPNGLEGYNAARRIDIVSSAAKPVSLLWVREISIAATAEHSPGAMLLRVNTRALDTPSKLQMQLANDAAMQQGLQTLPVGSKGEVTIPGLRAGERRFVRFTEVSTEGTSQSSPIMLLEVPENWGRTVFSMVGALQPRN